MIETTQIGRATSRFGFINNALCIVARRISLAVVVGALFLPIVVDAAASADTASATRDAAWDATFTRTKGWTGGDVAGTIDLGDGRTVWVFGDSWIGDVANGQHQSGSRMINNAIAVSPNPRDAAKPPRADEIAFHWAQAAAEPRAWIEPDLSRVRRHDADAAAIKDAADEQQKTWYWPTGGGALVRGVDGRSRMAVFLFHVGRKPGGKGVWNFRTVGGAVVIVDNVDEPADRWRTVQHDMTQTAVGGERETSWGLAVLTARRVVANDKPDGKGAGDEANDQSDDWVYIYGMRAKKLGGDLVLARVKGDAIEKPDTWEYFAGGKPEAWSRRPADAAALAEGIPTEFSVERTIIDNRETFVMVHSEPLLGKRIFVRTAPRPEGPWSPRQAIHTVTDVERHKSYFTYAAKGHAHLSRPGELLVTYLVNGSDFGAVFRDAEVYRPRFLRVPLNSINGAAAPADAPNK